MQIISSSEAPSVTISDYLHNGEPLVVCVDPGADTIVLADHATISSGDGDPFLMTYDETNGYSAYLTLVPARIERCEGGLRVRLTHAVTEITPVAVVARAVEPQPAIHLAMERALKLTGSLGKLLIDKPPLPRWLDKLGWLSTGPTSHEEVLSAVEELGVLPGYVLLRGSEGSTADPERFPSGLRGLSRALRRLGVPHLGIEHGMMDQSGTNLGEIFQFFFDFYARLKEEGVTFVEVNHQQETAAPRNIQVAIQAAASIQFNSAQFNRQCINNEILFAWTTSRLAATDAPWDRHLKSAQWLQHLMVPVPPPPTDETTAILNALSGAPLLIEQSGEYLSRLTLPSGRVLKANAPLTLTNDTLFAKSPNLKAVTYKSGCGIVAAFGSEGEVSPEDFAGVGTFALHSYRDGYRGVVDGPITVQERDVFTFAPIVNGVGLLGHPGFYLLPGPIQEMHHAEESIHISSQVSAPLLLYCSRDVLEIRCNGEVVPWGHDKSTGRLLVCDGHPLTEQPSLYTISFES